MGMFDRAYVQLRCQCGAMELVEVQFQAHLGHYYPNNRQICANEPIAGLPRCAFDAHGYICWTHGECGEKASADCYLQFRNGVLDGVVHPVPEDFQPTRPALGRRRQLVAQELERRTKEQVRLAKAEFLRQRGLQDDAEGQAAWHDNAVAECAGWVREQMRRPGIGRMILNPSNYYKANGRWMRVRPF